MAIYFKKYQNTNKQSKAFGKTFGRAVMIDTVDVDGLADTISEACTVTRHDILAVLSALGPAMKREMQQSKRVKIPYLGTFKMGMRTRGEEKSEDFSARNVEMLKVLFRPEGKMGANGKLEREMTLGARVTELPKFMTQAVVEDDDDTGNTGGDNGGGSDGGNDGGGNTDFQDQP